MKRSFAALTLATAAVLSGCAATSAPAPPATNARKVTFLCDRGQSIVVTFSDGAAVLEANGQRARLAQQRTGSGIHYTGEGHDLRGKGPELTWTNPSGTVLACRDQEWAMKQPQISEPRPPVSLAGTRWRLVHFESSDDAIGTVVPPRLDRYTLEFTDDGKLALQLDCNRASAGWQAQPSSPNGGTLAVTQGVMTQAMCPPGAIDTRIAQDLTRIRSYTFAGGRLNLALEADGGIYVWEPLPGG